MGYSQSETIELIKSALDNTRGISEYYVDSRQVIAKTSVGFPRILWSYGEKLIIDISDSPHRNEIVLNVSAEKEIWMNIGADPEKYKRRFINEFERLQEQDGNASPTNPDGQARASTKDSSNPSQTKEVHSDQYLSSGVKKLAIASGAVVIILFLMFAAVNAAILSNVPDGGPTDGGSGSAETWDSDDSRNPYRWTPSSESSDGESESDTQNTPNTDSDTQRENQISVSCTLATHFDNTLDNYYVFIMESEFPPDVCNDVLSSNPNVNPPRYEANCDELDVVSPIVYAENSSLNSSQRRDYNQYQEHRLIAEVLTSDSVSSGYTRCRLQTFDNKAELHIATPMDEWETTQNNLEEWGVSDNVSLWAYNSTYVVSEDEFNSTTD